jgi:hypothetical protein
MVAFREVGEMFQTISLKFSTNRPIAHDVTTPVTMHLEDKLAIYA